MAPEGNNGSYDGSGKGPESIRGKTIREVSESLVRVGFLDQNPEKSGVIKEEVEKIVESRFGFKSIEEMRENAEDKGGLREKEAKDKIGLLREATIMAMREVSAHNISLNDEFCLGSAHMKKILAGSGLEALATDISREYVPNEQMDRTLNSLEVARQLSKEDGRRGSKVTLVQKIDKTVAVLQGMTVNEEQEPYQFAICATLNEESYRLSDELGIVNSGVRAVIEQKNSRPVRESGEQGEKRDKQTIKQKVDILISIVEGKGDLISREQGDAIIQSLQGIGERIGQLGDEKQTDALIQKISELVGTLRGVDQKLGESNSSGVKAEQVDTVIHKLGEMSEKIDLIGKTSQERLITDQVRGFVEEYLRNLKTSGDEMVDVSKIMREAVEMFRGKLGYAGDAIKLAADVFLDTIGKFEVSTLETVKAQQRLTEIVRRITESEGQGELSNEDLLKIIQESRGKMTEDEEVREVARGRLNETANLSALLFVGRLPASFRALYDRMTPDMRESWDRRIAERVANLEAMRDSGADPKLVDSLYLEMERLLSSKSGEGWRERGELLSVNLDDIEKWLYEIETSDQPSNDISLNSDKLRKLYAVINGDTKIEGISGGDKERVIDWIKSRLLINDWFLAASTSHTVEDIFKTLARIHQGDSDNTIDRSLLKSMLDRREKRLGLEIELPVADAWDLRQKAYFEYVTATTIPSGGTVEDTRATAGYLVDLWNRHKSFIVDQLGKTEVEAESLFLTVGKPLMKKNDRFGIDKDYYVNLRNEGAIRRKIVEKCMAMELMDKVSGKDEFQKRQRAERAVELARRMSVMFYQDSVANIAFADADDYAELVNFKFIRYQDMVEHDEGHDPKDKPLGYYRTIKYIDTLTPSYLQTIMTKEAKRAKKEQGYSPFSKLEAADIDFDGMGAKETILFHFGSIVFKKVIPVQQVLLKSQTPKDFENFQDLQKRYEQINKVVKEAEGRGWSVLNYKENGFDRVETTLEDRQRKLRMWYIVSMLGMAVESNGNGWDDPGMLDMLGDTVVGKKFFGSEGPYTASFISRNQWEWMMRQDYTYKEQGKKKWGNGMGFRDLLMGMYYAKRRKSVPMFGGGKK